MRVWLVTSAVTFVPGNYRELAGALASNCHFTGLVILDNRDASTLKAGLGLCALGAPRTGSHLLRNWWQAGRDPRADLWSSAGKTVRRASSMNDSSLIQAIRDEGVDLIVNARTRCIYKAEVLKAPRLGCLNIHHGLLPEQRGTLCDLWALSESNPAGFTIHWMNEKIDAGRILRRMIVCPDGGERDFAAYLERASKLERQAIEEVIEALAQGADMPGEANSAAPGLKHRRNPTRAAIQAMRQKGMRL